MIILLVSLLYPDTIWTKLLGNRGDDYFSATVEVEDGFLTVGHTDSLNGGGVWITRFTSDGGLIWQKAYGGITAGGIDLKATPDGKFVIFGFQSFSNNRPDFYLLKIDENGDTIWSRSYYYQVQDFLETPASCCLTSDSGFLMVGQVMGLYPLLDVLVVKADKDGNLVWMRNYDSGGLHDFGHNAIETMDGYLIVGEGSSTLWVIKIDKEGNILWDRFYGSHDASMGAEIVQAPDNNYVIAGGAVVKTPYNANFYLLKIDPSGNLIWEREYDRDEYDVAYSMVKAEGGGFTLCGLTGETYPGDKDLWIIRVDREGEVLWDRIYGGDNLELLRFTSLRQLSDFGYIISSSTKSFGAQGYDGWLLRLSSDVEIEENGPSRMSPVIYSGQNLVITFHLGSTRLVSIDLYNVLGQRVAMLMGENWLPPGNHRFRFSPGVPAGTYFVKVKIGPRLLVKKVIILDG